ncbi:amidohydrolase 3 [Cordyceps fumosorosea ARSEF 2679]|uniref:Amidohydrolase 3 n=1 Tax=Cordyceps fumosorosea (strain ARSEF 2679) TaxID=1081104 RepID=A0A167TL87_CORFA|nr:amidohydrolase 3 [Cordyceps fumosorosea ARSEF 2679]OAA60714.1 amidohydrolase 3 [Cordyceps fumosorosea ARSEF 2679]
MATASEKASHGPLPKTQPPDDRNSTTVRPWIGYLGRAFLFIFAASTLAASLLQRYYHDAASVRSVSKTHCYASVQTLHGDQPVAQCFTVASGLFTDVTEQQQTAFDEAELKRRAEDGGAVTGHVIPGLWDGHGHLIEHGEMLTQVDLFGATTLDELRRRLREHIAEHPESGTKERWLRGMGWDQTDFGRMPTAADLDEDPALRGIYLFVDRIDGHCSLVSHAVLDLLPTPVPDVPGGEVVRDPGPGVFCDNALGMILARYPRPDDETRAAYVAAAMRHLSSVGIVGVHNAGTDPDSLRLLGRLVGGDDWTVRMYAMRECAARNTFCPADATKIEREDGLLDVRSVKLFADGALGSWGAAMLEPYTDDPTTSGFLLINETALAAITRQWAAAGFQVNIHAIGDRANRAALDAFEAALRDECGGDGSAAGLETCAHDRRFRLEHAQIIAPEDQPRLRALRVVPSIQPTHATSDMRYATARLGETRARTAAYRMRSFLDLHPVLGSDFPVEPPNPFRGMYAAVTRKSPATGRGGGADDDDGWHAEEALTLEQALWGFTGAPARGAFLEGKAGQIREGAYADWVVLDEPLGGDGFDVESLRSLRVRETWVAGRRVYRREDD